MSRIDVPGKFLSLSGNNDVYSSVVPSTIDWGKMSDNLNYLKSKGAQLIPPSFLTYPLQLHSGSESGNDLSYELVIFPSSQSLSRHWEVSFGRGTYNSFINFWVSSSLGVIKSNTIGAQNRIQQNFVADITEILTQSNVPDIEFVNITCSANSVQAGSSSAFVPITSIACFEVPRIYLNDGITKPKDNSIYTPSFVYNSPIFADSLNIRSVNSMVTLSSASIHETRRNGLFYWAVPIKSGSNYNFQNIPSVDKSTSPFSLFPLPVLIQGRRVFENQTTSSVECYFRVRYSGSVGDSDADIFVHVTSSIGNFSNTTTLSPENDAWISVSANIKSDGTGSTNLPLGNVDPENLQLKFAQTSGNGRVYCYSVCVGEKQKPF